MKIVFEQCLMAVGLVLVASAVGFIVLTPVLLAVSFLRNYGLAPDLSAVTQTAIFARPQTGELAKFLEWYNSLMPGYARFGSGLGMIAGAFWALGYAKPFHPIARILGGAMAGLIMGARLAMFITSDPPIVLGGALVCAAWTGGYLFVVGRPSIFKPLPVIELNLSS